MVTSGRSHPRSTVLMLLVQAVVWLSYPPPALSDECPTVGDPSTDCAFDVASVSTALHPPAVVQRLITTTCRAGGAANCSSHRYSFVSSASLRNGNAYLTDSNPSTFTFNVSAGGFANFPGNYTLRVLGYDQSCRAFQFCWTLIVPAPSSQTVGVFVGASPSLFSSYQGAYDMQVEIDYPVPANAILRYGTAINYTAARPQNGTDATLFTRTWTVSPYHPSFELAFETLGFSRSYGDGSTVTNVTWQRGAERLGMVVSPAARNGTHYWRTLSWQPGWPAHRFFVGLRRRDAVNRYPLGGVAYACLYVRARRSGGGAPAVRGAVSVTALLALAAVAIVFAV